MRVGEFGWLTLSAWLYDCAKGVLVAEMALAFSTLFTAELGTCLHISAREGAEPSGADMIGGGSRILDN
jgi:hypothetical protein